MEKSREELEKQLAEANAKLEQYQHRGQRLENYAENIYSSKCSSS